MDELLSNFGSYHPNALIIKIKSEFDLEPEIGEPLPGAIPIHAHEYIHYLHNLSTLAGLQIFYGRLLLFPAFIRSVMSDGKVHEISGDENIKQVTSSLNLIKAIKGSTYGLSNGKLPFQANQWKFSNLISSDVIIGDDLGSIPAYSIDVKATKKELTHKFILKIGLDFISEGIAYEIERELHRLNGNPNSTIDSHTPSFPYLMFQPLLEHLIGRTTDKAERISIGVLSLLAISPSAGLVNACAALKAGSEAYEKHIKLSLDEFNIKANKTKSLMPDLAKILEGSQILSEGYKIYENLIKEALEKREKNPFLEFVFAQQKLDKELFTNIKVNILDSFISQQKPDGKLNIYWIGKQNGIFDQAGESLTSFNVLQAAFHYIHHHTSPSGDIIATEALPNTECPFSGACDVERQFSQVDSCKKRPWEHPSASIEKNQCCFYTAAVMALKIEPSNFGGS